MFLDIFITLLYFVASAFLLYIGLFVLATVVIAVLGFGIDLWDKRKEKK